VDAELTEALRRAETLIFKELRGGRIVLSVPGSERDVVVTGAELRGWLQTAAMELPATNGSSLEGALADLESVTARLVSEGEDPFAEFRVWLRRHRHRAEVVAMPDGGKSSGSVSRSKQVRAEGRRTGTTG